MLNKTAVAMKALGQIVSSTGDVVTPYSSTPSSSTRSCRRSSQGPRRAVAAAPVRGPTHGGYLGRSVAEKLEALGINTATLGDDTDLTDPNRRVGNGVNGSNGINGMNGLGGGGGGGGGGFGFGGLGRGFMSDGDDGYDSFDEDSNDLSPAMAAAASAGVGADGSKIQGAQYSALGATAMTGMQKMVRAKEELRHAEELRALGGTTESALRPWPCRRRRPPPPPPPPRHCVVVVFHRVVLGR